MENVVLQITSNIQVGKDIYLMRLEGDLSSITNPGEFVEVKLDKYYLRRPISVSDYSSTHLDLLYKVLGRGTKDMSSLEVGTKLDIIVNLGNGFDVSKSTNPLLVAGGIGIAPMFSLAKHFNDLGFNIEATQGTAKFLKENGIKTRIKKKISEGSEEIIESIKKGYVTYVINLPSSNNSVNDGKIIRRAAIDNNVPVFTCLDTVKVLLDVLEEITMKISVIDEE